MSNPRNNSAPSTNKIYCEECKAHIPKGLWAKHQTCQRHLRARAAGLFYQKRRGKALADEAKKRLKEDPDALMNDPRFQVPGETLGFEPAEVRKSDLVTTKSRVKGVWVLLEDVDTGVTYYKNRLNGKIQRHRPIGLRDEDLELEQISTAVEEREPEQQAAEDESKPGEWQETHVSYWFGGPGEAEEAPDPAVKPFFEAESSQSEEAESDSVHEENEVKSEGDSDQPEADRTVKLRAAEESEETAEAIVQKAVFQEVPQTVAATFPKRVKKSAVQI